MPDVTLVSMEGYYGVVLVTAGCFCVYYALMIMQIHGKGTAQASY